MVPFLPFLPLWILLARGAFGGPRTWSSGSPDIVDYGESQTHTLSKRDWKTTWCNDEQISNITIGLTQAKVILRRMDKRLRNLVSYLDTSGVLPDPMEQSAEVASTFFTYGSFYDAEIYTKNSLHDQRERQFVVEHLRLLRDTTKTGLSRLSQLLNHHYVPRIEIYCGLQWLTEHNRRHEERRGEMFDNRSSVFALFHAAPEAEPLPWNDRPESRLWHKRPDCARTDALGRAIFARSDNPVGLVMNRMAGPFTSVISLNSPVIGSLSHDLEAKRRIVYPKDSVHISQLVDDELAAYLLRLLVRSQQIVADGESRPGISEPYYYDHSTLIGTNECPTIYPERRDDNECRRIKMGFHCAVWLASKHSYLASLSLNNFMYFAVAMYLDSYDWSTGFNRNITLAKESGGYRFGEPPPGSDVVYEALPWNENGWMQGGRGLDGDN